MRRTFNLKALSPSYTASKTMSNCKVPFLSKTHDELYICGIYRKNHNDLPNNNLVVTYIMNRSSIFRFGYLGNDKVSFVQEWTCGSTVTLNFSVAGGFSDLMLFADRFYAYSKICIIGHNEICGSPACPPLFSCAVLLNVALNPCIVAFVYRDKDTVFRRADTSM